MTDDPDGETREFLLATLSSVAGLVARDLADGPRADEPTSATSSPELLARLNTAIERLAGTATHPATEKDDWADAHEALSEAMAYLPRLTRELLGDKDTDIPLESFLDPTCPDLAGTAAHEASEWLRSVTRGHVARSYVEAHGWWADLIVDEFAFLKPWGITPGVPFWHQNGSFLGLECPSVSLGFHFMPDWCDHSATISVPSDGEHLRMDDFIRRHDPTVAFPPDRPFEVDIISARIRHWAASLRRILPDLLPPPTLLDG